MPRLALSNEDVRVIDFDLIRRSMRPRRKRGRVAVNALDHEELFVLLTTLRAANGDSLVDLFFRKRGVSRRTGMRRLAALVVAGYLGHVRLDGARRIYHLTAKALELTPRLQLLGHRTLCVPPAERQAMYCWLRSALWASLVKDGYALGRNGSALNALRRFTIDAVLEQLQSAPTSERDTIERTLAFLRGSEALSLPICAACSRCAWRGGVGDRPGHCPTCKAPTTETIVEHSYRCRACNAVVLDAGVQHDVDGKSCKGAMRQTGVVPYDIAWRKNGARYDVILIVVDDPSRSIEAEVDELPFVCFGQPSLPAVLRSTDPHSRFDRKSKKWATVGQRRAELVKAFGEKGKGDSVILLDYRPELQAYYHR